VPFVLERSSTVTALPLTTTRAWCRDTFGESSHTLNARFPADDVVSVGEAEGAIRRDEPARPLERTGAWRGHVHLHLLRCEPRTRNRAPCDDVRFARAITERLANFSHHSGQTGVGDENAGPHLGSNISALVSALGRPFDQHLEQLECFR
jgi:hypothetical protein